MISHKFEKLVIKLTIRITIFIILFIGISLINSLTSIVVTWYRWALSCFFVLILPIFIQFLFIGEKEIEESRLSSASIQWGLISFGLVFLGNLIDYLIIRFDYSGQIESFNIQTLPATATTLGIALIGSVLFSFSAIREHREERERWENNE